MAKNDEAILWMVDSTNERTGKWKAYIFRTRQAARDFYTAKKAKARGGTMWFKPSRAVWGPDNV